MAFRLAFTHSQGDVELEVFDATQNRIGLSDSTTNNEAVSFAAVAGQYYYARVYGYSGATNPSYTLTVDQPAGAGGGTGDVFEENDSFAGAYTLVAIDQTHTGLSINTANDDDYYRIVPTTSGTATVSLAFQHSQGDIDMRVFNASQTQIGISDSTGNSEQFSWSVTAGQAYYIRVYGYQGATNPNYSMTIDVPGTAPPRSSPPIRWKKTTPSPLLAVWPRRIRPIATSRSTQPMMTTTIPSCPPIPARSRESRPYQFARKRRPADSKLVADPVGALQFHQQ